MPRLDELRIKDFRNLGSVDIAPSPSINLIFGDNGSGKTSLLEAISVLAHGRSFRTHKFRRLINDEEGETTVFAKLSSAARGEQYKVGINRKRSGQSTFRIDGQNIQSAAELAKHLPLLVMDAHSFSLLEGSAKTRRQFFDWLVFHVKHDFKELWKAYGLCLKQRNSLLRRDKITHLEFEPWNLQLVGLSERIEALRREVLKPFLDAFSETSKEFGFSKQDISITYVNGWKEAVASIEQLEASFDRDRKQGFTTIGPHKADLKITIGATPAVEVLSRGQQKLLIAALFLAEARIKLDQHGGELVFLLDDLPAELDEGRLKQVAGWLNSLNAQLFVTGVNAQSLKHLWPDIDKIDHAMFHVKHGEVERL